MRTTHCVRAGWLVGALGACIVLAGTAGAQTLNTERPGSLLIFPKVSCSGQRDTVIQVSNTGNMPDTLHCFYLNGAPGRNGRPLCTSTDFLITLTKQQPTHWHVCTGRSTLPLAGAPDIPCAAPSGVMCQSDQAGLSPGIIPPVTDGFEGALVCAESDEDGTPLIMNAVKGEATIEGPGPDVSKYNGLAFQGSASKSNNDDTLDLDGVEYAACPADERFNFIPAGQNDPVIEEIGNGGVCSISTTIGCNPHTPPNCPIGETCIPGRSSVANNLTVLPCKLNFAAGTVSSVALDFSGTDEFETTFSGSTTISCWGTFTLAPPIIGAIASQFATVDISSPAGSPFVAVGESFHVDSVGNTAAASVNLITDGSDPSGQIRIY